MNGKYQINYLGEVLSIHKHCDKKRRLYHTTKRYLKHQTCKFKHTDFQYKFVILQKDGIRATKYIHSLLAEAFIPNPENKPSVYHIDGNTLNNNIDNLKWCSFSEFREITEKQRQTAKRNFAPYVGAGKKEINQYELDGTFVRHYNSLAEAHKLTGVNIGHLSEVLNGIRKTTGGYHWKFANKDSLEKS